MIIKTILWPPSISSHEQQHGRSSVEYHLTALTQANLICRVLYFIFVNYWQKIYRMNVLAEVKLRYIFASFRMFFYLRNCQTYFDEIWQGDVLH
jgi:hypothetical protein